MGLTEEPQIEEILVPENGGIPNHPTFPALIYRQVLQPENNTLADAFGEVFQGNGWHGTWRWGVYPFHHYHSTAHEVLGVSAGSARLRLGGPDGKEVEVAAGDLLLLPAGTGHQCVRHSEDFEVVGAYPPGHDADLLKAGEDLEAAKERISKVPLPEADPLYGPEGPLRQRWKS